MAILLQAESALTAPLPGTPFVPRLNDIWTSDTFSGASAEAIGRSSDALLRGTPQPWQGVTPGSFLVVNGRLETRSKTDPSSLLFGGITFKDMEVGVTIRGIDASRILFVDARRDILGLTPTAASYRMIIDPTGRVRLAKRASGGANVNLGSTDYPYAVGDKLALRVIGTQISLVKNGVVLVTIVDADIAAGPFAGIGGSSAMTGWIVDDFYIRKIDDPASFKG